MVTKYLGLLIENQNLIQKKIKAENEELEKFLGDICYLLYGEEKMHKTVSYDEMAYELKKAIDKKDAADEENAGILSDLCDILFEDDTRAENHGYENVIEQAKFCMERLTLLVQSSAQEREEVAKRQNKLDRIKRELGVDYEEKLFMSKDDVIKSENWGPVTESEVFRARIKCTCGKSNWIKLNLDNLEDSE